MYKKIILISLALFLITPQLVFAEDKKEEVHPCRTAWNDKMQEYDEEYITGLNNLLFQKTRTSVIIDSEALSYNLRSHNCKMYQICEVVRLSLFPEEEGNNQTVTGKLMRCQETPTSQFGGIFEKCSNTGIKTQLGTHSLWSKCIDQAEERISKIEIVTETEVIKSNSAKTTSNLVGYLMELNKKLDKLAIDVGDMIGILFDVTRKMTCVQKTCH